MKKLILATSVAFAAMSASAQAADLEIERELGLIVSGVVDTWAGVQIIDTDHPNYGSEEPCPEFDSCDVIFFDYPIGEGPGDETVFATGGEGLLSLPLADNLSIQSDVKYEYNSQAFDHIYKSTGPRYWYQGAVHVSWRDPMAGLLGAFGGMGGSSNGFPLTGRKDYRFVGGEAQFYTDMFTFYGQGGYISLDMRDSGCGGPVCLKVIGSDPNEEGIFGRGVVRWFPTSESRLQLEGTYLNLTTDFGRGFESDNDVWSWKARYDFDLGGLPIVGDLPVFLAYRGTLRDNCVGMGYIGGGGNGGDLTDHTFMVGTSYSFNGDRITIDRQGATVDTPDFGNMVGCSAGFQTLTLQ